MIDVFEWSLSNKTNIKSFWFLHVYWIQKAQFGLDKRADWYYQKRVFSKSAMWKHYITNQLLFARSSWLASCPRDSKKGRVCGLGHSLRFPFFIALTDLFLVWGYIFSLSFFFCGKRETRTKKDQFLWTLEIYFFQFFTSVRFYCFKHCWKSSTLYIIQHNLPF